MFMNHNEGVLELKREWHQGWSHTQISTPMAPRNSRKKFQGPRRSLCFKSSSLPTTSL